MDLDNYDKEQQDQRRNSDCYGFVFLHDDDTWTHGQSGCGQQAKCKHRRTGQFHAAELQQYFRHCPAGNSFPPSFQKFLRQHPTSLPLFLVFTFCFAFDVMVALWLRFPALDNFILLDVKCFGLDAYLLY